ncbi:MAG: Gfo/Idh/MocA family oxidoreductase [Chloroflexota bacterium]|nr:Gfo/Idh/MocA family oxidoreductase [Chloroflexota bacterium]
MESKRLKIGVIGAGVGQLHVAAYSEIPQVEVVALAGLDDRVPLVAAEYDIPRTYREYEDLLAEPDVEAVSVCVPNSLHAPVSIAALQAGKHVLVEKPLARTAAEAQEIALAAREHQRILMVSFDKRYRSDVQWIQWYIDSGALGEIYYAKAHWMRRSGIPRLGSWFVSKEQAGGGPLIDLGVHMLDVAMYLMGEPTPLSVTASTYAVFGPRGLKGWVGRPELSGERLPYEVEDLATAFIRLDNGATLLLEASWATHSSAGDDFGVTLYGSEGGVELLVRDYTYEDTVRAFTDIEGVPTKLAPSIPKRGGHLGVIEQFVSAILQDGPVTPSAEEGVRRAELLDACYESAALGHEVVLDQ